MPMTPCPACGAPIEYTGDGETIRCHFCGTEFQVTEEDGRPRFDVAGQPGPQKEVLRDQVSQIVDEPVSSAVESPGEPDLFQQSFNADLNPTESAAGYTAHTGEAARWSGVDTLPPAPPVPQPMQSTPAEVVRRPGTPGRWIAIGVGVVLLICLACVALAALVLIPIMQNRGF